MAEDRSWMYNRYANDGRLNQEYLYGLLKFRDAAIAHALSRGHGEMIRCPCRRCKNEKLHDMTEVEVHLLSNGFVQRYNTWVYHGEDYPVNKDVYCDGVSLASSSNVEYPVNQVVEESYFDIRQGDGNKSTYNSGVCVKGSCYDDDDHVDYYGVIEEIWELSYGYMHDKVVLFKCFWFDTFRNMQTHPRNGMVQIKQTSRASKDDPFILASQAQQVYYLSYVSSKRDHKQWCVAMKTNARSHVDWTHMQNVDVTTLSPEDVFQEEQQPPPVLVDQYTDIDIVQQGDFVILQAGQDDDKDIDSDDSSYESDYPDDNDDDDENVFVDHTDDEE